MPHNVVEPDKTGDKCNVLLSHFCYMFPILIVFFFHPFNQTGNALRYKHSTMEIITIGIDMLGIICEVQIIMIRENSFVQRTGIIPV